jgi:hypothetical protein
MHLHSILIKKPDDKSGATYHTTTPFQWATQQLAIYLSLAYAQPCQIAKKGMWTDALKAMFTLPSHSACSARAHLAARSCSFPLFILFHQRISHNHFIQGGNKQDVMRF